LSLNPAAAFLTENYEYSPEFDGTPCAQIYQQYVQWCEANGYKSLNAANFGREVNSMFNVVKTRPMYDGKRTNLYAGIEVKEDAEIGQMDY